MTGGDVQRAQELFDAFFEAFPGIKTWMEEKKISGRETGKVTNIFGGNIEVTDGRSNEGEIDRHSVNYGIQSSSSMVAGYSIYNLYDKLTQKGIPGTPVGFVHDALDYTANIDDMITFIELALETMEDELYKELGTPMKIDYEVGVNARQLCEISSYEKTDSGLDIVLSGFQNDVMDMIEKYSNHSKKYIVQDVEVLSEKESKTSWEELYTAKGALS